MVKESIADQFVYLAAGPHISYDEPRKAKFHRLAKKVAKLLAVALQLPEGSYDIRTNLAGIAVCGETTLHGENIYIQLGQSSIGPRFMYRSCKGRKDYCGGQNQWMAWEQLRDIDAAAATMLRMTARG